MILSSYFKIALRSLKKRLTYTLINVLGLSVGLASFLILIAYTNYEESYDGFHENKNEVYRIIFERKQNNETISVYPAIMPPLGDALKREIPEVQGMTRFSHKGGVVKNEHITTDVKGLFYVDADFFKLFSFKLIAGDPKTALAHPRSIVITQEMATTYFGDKEPLGQVLKVANDYGKVDYKVTGVAENPPKNTSLDFQMLCTFETIYMRKKWLQNNWMFWGFETLISVKEGTDVSRVKQKLTVFANKHKTDPMEATVDWSFDLQPIQDIHLKSDFRPDALQRDSSARTIHLLKVIALLIVLISWVNYVNLSTASSSERAIEIGVLKSIGAHKRQITIQFLVESSIVFFMAVGLAIGFVFLLITPFCGLLDIEYGFDLVLQTEFWIRLPFIVFIGIIASGLYPAFVLASFKTTEVLKSKNMNAPSSAVVRKILVGFQFVISILLIVCTVIMIQQNNFMKQKDLGADIDNVIALRRPELKDNVKYRKSLKSFGKALEQISGVSGVSAGYSVPSMWTWSMAVWKTEEGPESQKTHMVTSIDENYIGIYGLKLLAGKNFEGNAKIDATKVIVSKKALELFGISTAEDALGTNIKVEGFQKRNFEIIGVVEDYHHLSLHQSLRSMVFLSNIGMFRFPKVFSLKLDNDAVSIKQTMAQVKTVFDRFFPGDIFEHSILKERYSLQYQEEDINQNVFTVFSLLAIVLSCVGVIGLSSFIALLKARDIAVHKVLGANKTSVFWQLSKEFMIVLAVAAVLAIPLVYVFMEDWLSNFPYRIAIALPHFIMAFVSVFAVMILVIFFNMYKALVKNPVHVLKE